MLRFHGHDMALHTVSVVLWLISSRCQEVFKAVETSFRWLQDNFWLYLPFVRLVKWWGLRCAKSDTIPICWQFNCTDRSEWLADITVTLVVAISNLKSISEARLVVTVRAACRVYRSYHYIIRKIKSSKTAVCGNLGCLLMVHSNLHSPIYSRTECNGC